MSGPALKHVSVRLATSFGSLLLAGAACAAQGGAPSAGESPRPSTTPPDLFAAVKAQDAALFDAYNHCNLKKFGDLIAVDVEFFHDHGGATLGRDALMQSVAKNICGKVTRELVADSLEVYPMDNYGAIEIGTHRFRHADPAQPVGEGKFVHLWRYDKKTQTWQVTRVLSFDHHELAP